MNIHELKSKHMKSMIRIESLEERNLKEVDPLKMKNADYLLLMDRVFVQYENIGPLFTSLLKELDKERKIIILKSGDFNFDDVVKANVFKQIEDINNQRE